MNQDWVNKITLGLLLVGFVLVCLGCWMDFFTRYHAEGKALGVFSVALACLTVFINMWIFFK